MTTVPRQFDHTGMEILNPAESLRLLSTVPIGRLVFTQGGLPAIRLVNFLVDDDTVVFTTTAGDTYRAAERGDVVAFEADEIDADRHLGWTVTAAGHLSVIDPTEAKPLRHTLPLHTWAPHHDHHLIRLGIESLEGRRLVAWGARPHENR